MPSASGAAAQLDVSAHRNRDEAAPSASLEGESHVDKPAQQVDDDSSLPSENEMDDQLQLETSSISSDNSRRPPRINGSGGDHRTQTKRRQDINVGRNKCTNIKRFKPGDNDPCLHSHTDANDIHNMAISAGNDRTDDNHNRNGGRQRSKSTDTGGKPKKNVRERALLSQNRRQRFNNHTATGGITSDIRHIAQEGDLRHFLDQTAQGGNERRRSMGTQTEISNQLHSLQHMQQQVDAMVCTLLEFRKLLH